MARGGYGVLVLAEAGKQEGSAHGGGGGFPASIAHLEEKITSSHAEGESGKALGTHGGKISTADLDPWEKKNL